MCRVGSLLLALLSLALSGCALPWQHANEPQSLAPDRGQPVIVCLGDSLTAGDGAPAGQSYPDWLQRRLNAEGYDYRVINAGVSGNRVADGLARLDRDVLRFHPAITIVELGSNDPGHTPAAQWTAGLEKIVVRLRAGGTRVVLAGLDEPGMSEIYRSVATRYGVPLVWFTAGLWSRPGLWGNAHHPNGAGYQVVMGNVWAGLMPLLRR